MDYLFNRELAQINPLLGLSAELATNEIKEKAELSLLEKLEQNPQILFEVSPLLNGHFKRCEEQFCEMISELFSDTVVLPKALDFGQYGYAEFIAEEPAKTTEEAENFFYRLGGVCALFQTFGSTDFHCENILAKGEFPAVVDLETFLGVLNAADKESADLFQRDFSRSVFCSGILPKRVNDREISPLLCKDEHSILPVINGERVDVRGYLSYFDAGFRAIYRRCIDEKNALLQYLERFSACRFRCLLRNTDDYAKLLRGLYSVKILSSENYRDERVKSLKTALGQGNENQRAVAEEEINSLLRGDIPFFHCTAGSKNLYSGEKRVARDFFGQMIEENVRYRMENLSEKECEFELAIIHQSLRCAHIPANKPHYKAACAKLSFAEEAGKVFDEIWENRLVCPSGKAGWLDHISDGNHFGYLPITYEWARAESRRLLRNITLQRVTRAQNRLSVILWKSFRGMYHSFAPQASSIR